MKVFINIILFLTSITIYAQFSDYPFLKRDSNVFLMWNKSPYFDSIFEKFNQLQISGNEQIKILHIGDSHIQADIFTNQIRRLFSENFFHLIGPPAIAFPYELLKSNQPITIKVECTGQWKAFTSNPKNNISFLGLTAITNDSCAHKIHLYINKKALPNGSFNRLKIFTNNDTTIKISNPLIINKLYSQINDTIAINTFILNKYVDSIVLNIKLNSDSVLKTFHLYGIIPETDDPGIIYHTLGINGAKAKTFLNTFVEDFISFQQYDLVVISLGTNDVYVSNLDSTEVKENLKKLITKIKQKNPLTAILLTTPMEHYYKRKHINSHAIYFRDIIYEISKSEGCAIWDLYIVAGGHGSINQWYNHKLTKNDKLHLNTQGYYLLGNLFFEAFINTYLNGFLEK